MSFGRLRDVARTLRFRLLLWNTVVVLLIVFPTLAGVRAWLRHRHSTRSPSSAPEPGQRVT